MPTDVLTTPGAGVYVVPAGVFVLAVECEGGGGGGGKGETLNSGASGGGGAYSKLNVFPVTPGQNINYSVGIAGLHVNGSNAGLPGGDTWFDSTGTVLAKGGQGAVDVDTGGAGGQASAGVGDVKTSGGNGANAGAGGNGAAPLGGAGGSGPGNPGGNGTAPGGGGGSGGPGSTQQGGDGARGQINVTYAVDVVLTSSRSEVFNSAGIFQTGPELASSRSENFGTNATFVSGPDLASSRGENVNVDAAYTIIANTGDKVIGSGDKLHRFYKSIKAGKTGIGRRGYL